jgi:DNA replication protein DnaC
LGFGTEKQRAYTAETLSKILEDIYSFVKNGFNLFLFGDTGTGKTSWAVKLMNNYFSVVCEKNIYEPKGLYISVASFLRDAKLQMNYKNENYYELLQQIQSCDIVIWDDIFQTDPTNYESQWLYSYINDRMFAQKCNIFTSNLSPEQLEKVDSRLHSRICTSSDILRISGMDRRSDNKFTTSKLFVGGGD